MIKDDHLPPTEWRVIPGKDKNVRVAEIQTQNGIIVRPIVKLCILPTNQNNQYQFIIKRINKIDHISLNQSIAVPSFFSFFLFFTFCRITMVSSLLKRSPNFRWMTNEERHIEAKR